jgi:hypothetical protein
VTERLLGAALRQMDLIMTEVTEKLVVGQLFRTQISQRDSMVRSLMNRLSANVHGLHYIHIAMILYY